MDFGADAMGVGNFPEHVGDLPADGGRTVVAQCPHSGNGRLLACGPDLCQVEGPIILYTGLGCVKSVLRPVPSILRGDLAQVPRNVRDVCDEGGQVLDYAP